MGGWELLDSDLDLGGSRGRAAKVPVSAGSWRLWLRTGEASRDCFSCGQGIQVREVVRHGL